MNDRFIDTRRLYALSCGHTSFVSRNADNECRCTMCNAIVTVCTESDPEVRRQTLRDYVITKWSQNVLDVVARLSRVDEHKLKGIAKGTYIPFEHEWAAIERCMAGTDPHDAIHRLGR